MQFDVIVVGAGVEGSATAYQLIKHGAKRVLLLEQVLNMLMGFRGWGVKLINCWCEQLTTIKSVSYKYYMSLYTCNLCSWIPLDLENMIYCHYSYQFNAVYFLATRYKVHSTFIEQRGSKTVTVRNLKIEVHLTSISLLPSILQFSSLHTRGSSHGSSRITRRAYSKPYYVHMMDEAYRLWADIEKESGTKLYV
jgi:hypothetical protein